MRDRRFLDRPGAVVAVVALILLNCGPLSSAAPGTSTSTPSAPVSASPASEALHWASYESHAEPRYRLLFEGGTPARAPEEIRILERSGAERARGDMKPVANETLRLCARGTTYGVTRATIPVPEALFREFIRDDSAFVIEVRIGATWSRATIVNLCHATE